MAASLPGNMKNRSRRRLNRAGALGLSLLFMNFALGPQVQAQTPASAKVDFAKDIQPIFETSCYACHGPKMQMSGLRLDSAKAALAGGQSGVVIIPGKAAESALYRHVAGIGEHARMPMNGKPLEDAQIARIRT